MSRAAGPGGRGHDSRTFGLSHPCRRSTARLIRSTMTAVTTISPMTRGMIALDRRGDGGLPEAGEREHLLDHDRAAEHDDELDAQDAERGPGGVAEHVVVDHASVRDAACPQRPDVVEAQGVEHRAAHLLGDAGGRPDREGDDRKDDRRQPPGDRGLGFDVAGRRHPLQPEGEDQDEDRGRRGSRGWPRRRTSRPGCCCRPRRGGLRRAHRESCRRSR